MWLCEMGAHSPVVLRIPVHCDQPSDIAKLKLWNYNKSLSVS